MRGFGARPNLNIEFIMRKKSKVLEISLMISRLDLVPRFSMRALRKELLESLTSGLLCQ